MVATPKNGQLRVRINERTHQRLADLAEVRRGGVTVSDIVRDAIESYLVQCTKNSAFPALSEEAAKMLLKLARELDRNPVQVMEDCIEGIYSMTKSGEPPLITMELELRRKYYSERTTRVPVPDNESATQLLDQK